MLFLVGLLILSVSMPGQKRPLSHTDYDSWKSISGSSITDDGRWVTYAINPQQGDGWLYIYDVISSKLDSMERGSGAAISPGINYMVYTIRPRTADVRNAKVKKLKDDETPKNNMAIRILSSGITTVVEKVKSFSLADKNSEWMAYLMEKKPAEKKERSEAGAAREAEKTNQQPGRREPEQKGTDLILFNPVKNKELRFEHVLEYSVARDGASISFVQVKTDTAKIDSYTVSMFDTKKEEAMIVFEGKGTLRRITPNRTGDKLAFVHTADTGKIKIFDLYLSDGFATARKIVDAGTKGIPEGWCLNENTSLSYSDDNTRLFFGTSTIPVKEAVDTLLPEEKFSVDVWSWHDDVIQPMQKKQLQSELRKSYQAVYHIDRGVMIQLADQDIPSVRLINKSNNDLALGSSNQKYRKETSWSSTNYTDYYLVNVETGEKKLLMEKIAGTIQVSPGGKYLLYWCIDDRAWKSMPMAGGKVTTLTSNAEVSFFDELHDTPDEPGPHGTGGWLEGERYALIYDMYDIWKIDVTGAEKPVNLTGGKGRSSNVRYRYVRLDSDEQYINPKSTAYLSAFNYNDKKSGFYTLVFNKPGSPSLLVMDDCKFGNPTKPKNADKFMITRGTYVNYPEIYISDLRFEKMKKVSLTNPQQSQYIWGSVELVEWLSFDRSTLQGLLYKPGDFDPSKKYPMIVYFYERSSDEFHNYSAPSPSASTVNRTYAVSNGYLVFVPDIPYVEGYPGMSCYNAVVSGTYELLNRFSFIDKDRLGLDGQSWGGYQIAWLVTRTDLFAAAFAGAPVSNMISAYGGIRWGTGMSRQFQYEDTQSRIGGTIWDRPMQFIENSPIFSVPRINTPLLIMHNDEDGAVPWYQGIEYFMALRRLGKPAWMLTYNNEDHNLVKRPARMDLSIRKMQFFDHYLKGEPMPAWMKYGIPQTQKGKDQGYELVK